MLKRKGLQKLAKQVDSKKIGRKTVLTDELYARIVEMHFDREIAPKDIVPHVPVGLSKVCEAIRIENEVRRRLAAKTGKRA